MRQKTGIGRLAVVVSAVLLRQAGAGTGEVSEIRAPDVVVTATRTAKSVRDVPASVAVMTPGQVEKAGAATVDRLFTELAGVELQGSGLPGSTVKLNLRGLTPEFLSKRVLVLVDGRRVNEQYQGSVDFSQLAADGIERIEVLRGPASALYGSNAMGGVINIVTKRGRSLIQAGGPATRIEAEAGSFGTEHYRVSHGGMEGRLDYFVTGSYVQTDGYARNTDGTRRDWEAWNVEGNAGWQVANDAEVRFFSGRYEGRGTDENSDRRTDRDFQNLAYAWNWSDRLDAQLNVRVWRGFERHIYDWKFGARGVYRQDTLAAEVAQSLWASESQLVTGGFETRRDAVDIDEFSGPIDRATTLNAFYVQDEILLGESVRVLAGARDDFNSGYGSEVSPRLGLLWKPAAGTDLYASANRAHRTPSLSDRYVRAEYNGFLFVGNPDLGPETLMAYEIGLRQKVGDRADLELAVFHNDLKGAFDFMLDPDGVFRPRNVTRLENTGVETSARFRFTKGLTGFAHYTFTDGEYTRFPANPEVEGKRLAYLATHKGGAGMELDAGRLGTHALSCRAAGPRYGDAQNTRENRIAGAVVADWRSRLPLGRWVTATFRAENILDQTYQESPGLNQAGRTLMAGLDVAF